MTEEEYFRKNYPDSCYGDRLLSPYWDYFQGGVEFGERESEKRIAELEAQIEKMKCCGNCIYQGECDLSGYEECKNFDKWEIKEK